MTWYYALGNERQGPVDDATLDRLIATGVVSPETLVWKAGMADWQPLAQARPQAALLPVPIVPPPAAITPAASEPSTQPRFSTPTPTPTPTPAPAQGGFGAGPSGGYGAGSAGAAGWNQAGYAAPETADQLYARVIAENRTFAIGDVIGRGWELVSGNFGLAIGVAAIWIISNVAGAIPCLGILISLAVTPILQAGVYRVMLKLHRGEPAEFGDAFTPFSTSYLQLFLFTFVQLILIGVSLIPGYALIFMGNMLAQRSEGASLVLSMLGLLVMLPPAIYLGVSWSLAMPLIVDKGLDFWPAMELSRKVAAKRFFSVFGLLFLCGLIVFAGVIALCLGVFVAAPLALAAFAVGYDALFGRR